MFGAGTAPSGGPSGTRRAGLALTTEILRVVRAREPLSTVEYARWTCPRGSLDSGLRVLHVPESVEDWLRAKLRSEGARAMLRIATQAIFAADPRELSLLDLLHCIH